MHHEGEASLVLAKTDETLDCVVTIPDGSLARQESAFKKWKMNWEKSLQTQNGAEGRNLVDSRQTVRFMPSLCQIRIGITI